MKMKTTVVFCFICVLAIASAGDFKKAALKRHNQLRKKHGSPPMKLTSAMNQKAQAWAEKLAETNTMQHSQQTQGGPGENFYMTMPAKTPEEDAVAACQAWYDEIHQYNFNNPGFSNDAGHFSQLVWKESTELGVGLATSSSGAVYVVANYNPAGNNVSPGFFEENVKRPEKERKKVLAIASAGDMCNCYL